MTAEVINIDYYRIEVLSVYILDEIAVYLSGMYHESYIEYFKWCIRSFGSVILSVRKIDYDKIKKHFDRLDRQLL